MTRSFLGSTTLAVLVTAIFAVIGATIFLVWPHWQKYQAVKSLVEFVTVEPCVCIYSGVRTDKLVIKSKPVLDQHVQKVKRWRGSVVGYFVVALASRQRISGGETLPLRSKCPTTG
jgi:hypothetical protein